MSVPAARFAELGVATTDEVAGREGLVAGAFVRVVPGTRVDAGRDGAAAGVGRRQAAPSGAYCYVVTDENG